jgi:hypothetical protein
VNVDEFDLSRDFALGHRVKNAIREKVREQRGKKGGEKSSAGKGAEKCEG